MERIGFESDRHGHSEEGEGDYKFSRQSVLMLSGFSEDERARGHGVGYNVSERLFEGLEECFWCDSKG